MLPVRRFDIDRIGAVVGEFDPADFRLVAFQLFKPERRLPAGPECSADADSRTDSAAEPDAAAEAEADADPDPDPD